MKVDESQRINLGGKSAFNWKLFGLALPLIIFEPPLTESEFSLNKHELLLNYVSHLCSKEEEYLISASSVKREKDSEDEISRLIKERSFKINGW